MLQGFAALAELLCFAVRSPNPCILGSVADTLNSHRDIFCAIGTFRKTLAALLEAYRKQKDRKRLEQSFLLPLSDLVSQVTDEHNIAHQLLLDIRQLDHQAALVAFHPAADEMINGGQPTGLELYAGGSHPPTNGDSMDATSCSRLFRDITASIRSDLTLPSGGNIPDSARLLAKLRSFDVSSYDNLMEEWIIFVLPSPNFFTFLPSMIVAGCLPLESFISWSAKALEAPLQSTEAAGLFERGAIAVRTLELFAPDEFPEQHLHHVRSSVFICH